MSDNTTVSTHRAHLSFWASSHTSGPPTDPPPGSPQHAPGHCGGAVVSATPAPPTTSASSVTFSAAAVATGALHMAGATHPPGAASSSRPSLATTGRPLPRRISMMRDTRARAPHQRRAAAAALAPPHARMASAGDLGVDVDVFGRAPAAQRRRCARHPLSCGTGESITQLTVSAGVWGILGAGRSARSSGARAGCVTDKERAFARFDRTAPWQRAGACGRRDSLPPASAR